MTDSAPNPSPQQQDASAQQQDASAQQQDASAQQQDASARTSFDPVGDPKRRHRTGLYLVAFDIPDSRRRARIRRILASVGLAVAPGAFEVPTSPAGKLALERALALELHEGDSVRLYPVCANCRTTARIWGDGELAALTPALIF